MKTLPNAGYRPEIDGLRAIAVVPVVLYHYGVAGLRAGFDWRVHPALSWAGLGLIALAVFGFEAGEHFPGAHALVPVIGAVLIIANGRDENPVNRMLRSPGFLFFGVISYSLYLWHWPIVTLAKYALGGELPFWAMVALLALSVAVSWASWRFIETPVRRGALDGWRLVGGYASVAAVLLAVAFSFAFSDGRPGRFDAGAQPYIAATRDFIQDWARCTTPDDGPWAGMEICPIGPERPPEVLVWGDSHGRAFKEGLDRLAFETGRPGILIWRGGCPPLIGVLKRERVSTAAEEAACAASQEAVLAGLAGTPTIDTVLLIGRWAYYAEGTGVGRDAQNWITLSAAAEAGRAGEGQGAIFAAALANTLDRFMRHVRRVFILRQVPEIVDYSAGTAARAIAYGQLSPEDVRTRLGSTPRAALEARFAAADAALAAAADREGVGVIDLWEDLCSPEICTAYLNGTPIYFDNNHVTNTGALALRGRFAPVFRGN